MPTIPAKFRFIGDETPTKIWWKVNGSLVNFSTGYTFSARLVRADDSDRTVIWEKVTGFTGAVGSGTSANGSPNLTITWDTTGEWNNVALTAGRHVLQIKATKIADSTEETMQIFYDLGWRFW